MFKSSHKLYTERFINHLEGFIAEHKLFNKDSRLLIAVSGGLDSMALLHAIYELQSFGYSNSVRVLHVNHGTRSENIHEARLVADYCKLLGFEFIEERLSGLHPDSNFEHIAREKRYDALYSRLAEDEYLVLAHHIDDSFEWSVLQMFRSSNLKSALGIPLKRDQLIRPFMCVTKAQIKKYIEAFDLPFLEDPTNEQTRYERNYIRAQISESFAPRYKNYLFHYVNRQNEQARALGVHLTQKVEKSFHIRYFDGEVHLYNLADETTHGLEVQLLKAIKFLSPSGRSSLAREINKCVAAYKAKKSGPMRLGPNVQVYLSQQYILVATLDYDKRDTIFRSNDQDFVQYNFEHYQSYLEMILETARLKGLFPLYVEVRDKRFNFEAGKAHKHIKFDEAQVMRNTIPAIKLLKYWAKPKNQKFSLELRFLFSV